MNKNLFIVFEWVDGSGKDTQLFKTIWYLRDIDKNIQIWLTKEPTSNTNFGREILFKLKNWWFKDGYEALQLYVKDRESQSIIRREILNHSTILSTRFDYSTYAYQWVQWLSFNEIYMAHNYKNILIPDITFIFDVWENTIKSRLKSRWWTKEYFESLDFLLKVREKYLETYHKLKDERNIHLIDANWSIDEVFKSIKLILDKYYKYEG